MKRWIPADRKLIRSVPSGNLAARSVVRKNHFKHRAAFFVHSNIG